MKASELSIHVAALALLLFALGLGIASVDASTSAPVPEPRTFWDGPPSGPVPTTLSGGRVIHVQALSALLKHHDAVVVDVSNEEKRPAGLGAEVLWSVPPHLAIPGSHWLPGVGLGTIPPARDEFFRHELLDLTGGHLDHPVVIYCHRSCWLSWNAAKRAIGYGFRSVYWLPDGIEGWRAAGLPTQPTSPTRE